MGLFEERQASAKKVVALQNEIISLKTQLHQASAHKTVDCSACEEDLKLLKEHVAALKLQVTELLAAQAPAPEQDKPKRRGRQSAQDKQEDEENAL
jgi:hypothetical protein